MLSYSNPRSVAEFDKWPSGSHRVKCRFHVEQKNNQFRVGRTTTDISGMWNKTKYDTYGGPACIVNGSDGKTYVLQYLPLHNAVKVSRHDFMNSEEGTVYESSNKERFTYLLNLIKCTKKEGD